MSVSHCLDALRWSRVPMTPEAIRAELETYPEVCPHADCGEPKNCRQRNADYMRAQWVIHRSKRK